jgi:4-amino-4-deoxy-L-arabinose transferase-like glycosyltransferase
VGRDLARWAFVEFPFLIVIGGALQVVFWDGFDRSVFWHTLSWLLAGSGALGVAAVLAFPALRRDDVSLMDVALPVVTIGLLAASAILAAQGFYSWGWWALGVGIGAGWAIIALVSTRRAEGRSEREAAEAELDRRDLERHLTAKGDTPHIL